MYRLSMASVSDVRQAIAVNRIVAKVPHQEELFEYLAEREALYLRIGFFGIRVTPGRHLTQQTKGLIARLLTRKQVVAANGYAACLAVDPPLSEIGFGSHAYPQPEPRQLSVEVDYLAA